MDQKLCFQTDLAKKNLIYYTVSLLYWIDYLSKEENIIFQPANQKHYKGGAIMLCPKFGKSMKIQ